MAAPSKTHFPRSGGQQWVDSFYHYGEPVGNVLYVSSTAGTSTGPGYSPETAYSTINAAVTAATASNGDVIVVMPGHAETVTAAAGVAISKAGVSVIGMGVGRNRPVITFTTANAASFDITAANVLVENLVLVNGKDGQTAMMNIQAADVIVRRCEFKTGDASTQCAEGILTTAAADRLRIEDCLIHGTLDAGTTSAVHIVGGDSVVLKGNLISGAHGTTGSVLNDTTAGTNWFIVDNSIFNQTADANNKALILHASTTGVIGRNNFVVIDSTSPAPVTAAGAYVAGNYFTGAAGVAASTLM